jgi:hypothetical protein
MPVAYQHNAMASRLLKLSTYSLCNVVDYDSTVGISVVHGRERLIALLTSRVPDLKLDRRVLVEGNGLGEEGGADGGFSVVVELVLDKAQHERRLGIYISYAACDCLAMICLRTFPTADSPAKVSLYHGQHIG